MEGVSKKQIIAIRTMLAKAGIADEEEKKGFVLMITDMRTDSISQMTYEEASKAQKFLKDKLIQLSATNFSITQDYTITFSGNKMVWKNEWDTITYVRIN